MIDDAVEIGNIVTRQRKRAGLTQAELAEAAGLSAGGLSRIETGRVYPRRGSLNKIADALNIPVTDLAVGVPPRMTAANRHRIDARFLRLSTLVTQLSTTLAQVVEQLEAIEDAHQEVAQVVEQLEAIEDAHREEARRD